MFNYLVKITDEENLFYDSEERLYRYRMHCPACGETSGCRCFETIEKAYDFMENDYDYLCSSRCFIESAVDDYELGEAMKEIGLISLNFKSCIPVWVQKIIRSVRYYLNTWRLRWYIYKYTRYISEKDAREVIDSMDLDYDSIGGMSC